MEEKKIVVYVLHGFWENEFTNGVQWWMCRLTWRRS